MPSLFISHVDKDNSIAQEVAERVKAQGFDYFLDDDILPGEKWEERIHNAMRECIAVLFCATPDALQSKYVFAEIVMTRFRGIPLIPLIFTTCDLPSFITGTPQHDDFLSDREAGYRKLFAALELLKLKVASEWSRCGRAVVKQGIDMAGKYTPPENYLCDLPKNKRKVALSFIQIERILNNKLSSSAFESQKRWEHGKDGNHVNDRAWSNAGWKVERLDVKGKWVKFVRAG